MKELSEKAKRYDEALKKAKDFYKGYKQRDNQLYADDLESLFPELKESEDERIRKWCISHFKECINVIKDNDEYKEYLSNKVIALLEKQGEQKPADTEKGTNGSEREFPIPEPPLTIKHAKEVMGIKQDDAWSEEDEKCLENAIMYCEWARDIAPNLHCYEISEKSINWLKSLKERYTWKPSDEQMNALNYVVNLMASSERPTENDLYYNILKSLRQQLKKLREK